MSPRLTVNTPGGVLAAAPAAVLAAALAAAPAAVLAAALVAALVAAPTAYAATACHAEGAVLTQPLVELYTSEGCDSCPPGERWFAQRFAAGTSGVPLAFHVDYWDRLGWRDRFATHANTERQYEAMRANGATFVYTPQVLVQGRDAPHWADDADGLIEAASRRPARAKLAVDVTVAPSGRAGAKPRAGIDAGIDARVHVLVSDAALARDTDVFAAYTDSGLVSEVKAGENRGRRLTHAHVVRALTRLGAVGANGHFDAGAHFERPSEPGSDPTLVVFVQREANGDVLQALVVPLDTCARN